MPKITISYEFASEAEAVAFVTGNRGASPSVTTGAPPPGNAPPRTAAPPAPGAASPPPGAPGAPPRSAPPPAPPPAPAAPASTLHTEVLQAMSAYGKSPHKAAGIKRILARIGLTAVTGKEPPDQLEWLKAVFSPQEDGAFLSPEQVEAS